MANRSVGYVYSQDYLNLCDLHPKIKGRSSMVHGLIESYDLLRHMTIIEPQLATRDDLLLFHSEQYINALEFFNNKPEDWFDDSFDENDSELMREHGLDYDCSLFPSIYEYCTSVAGGTIAAASGLMEGLFDTTISWNGGWHHGQLDEASGFCYVNDIVISILKLLKKFKKILYIDLDCHHGDNVEQAFFYSNKVLTLSIHKYGGGFFPGTGSRQTIGRGKGKYHAINIPLNDGISNDIFVKTFKRVFNELFLHFAAEAIVLQCGADCITGDPLGCFNLTSDAICQCVEHVLESRIPTMILGGGGYNLANTARCWAQVTSRVLEKKLNSDIPEHNYFDMYGPDYSLDVVPSHRRNENSQEYIEDLLKYVTDNIRQLNSKEKENNVTVKFGKEVNKVSMVALQEKNV